MKSICSISKKDPLVSLAIPTLNRPDHLKQSLGDALGQNYSNLEIIVSDNGSRDNTTATAKAMSIGDRRVRFRRNEITVPIHEHFNQCLYAARGEYFILLCDDDRITTNFVSELVSVVKEHPDVVVVLPANVTIDSDSNVISEYYRPWRKTFSGTDIVFDWMYGRGSPQLFAAVTTVLSRTEILRTFGGYQALGGARNDDNLLFLQCALTGKVGFARNAVFKFRVHDSYGNRTTYQQIVDSYHQMLRHIRSDAASQKMFTNLTSLQRKKIIYGISLMTARELLFHNNFQENPFSLKKLSILKYRFDIMFHYIVFKYLYREVKKRIKLFATKVFVSSLL